METIEKSIIVDAPLSAVYYQWTLFEEFPEFMEEVYEVNQLSDTRLRWKASLGGRDKEWDGEIIEQVPDERVAWRSSSGTRNGGTVTLLPLGAERTRVDLKMEFEPEGALETSVDAFEVLSRQVEGDLERFKHLVEARYQSTQAWRGHGPAEEIRLANEPRSKRLRGEE